MTAPRKRALCWADRLPAERILPETSLSIGNRGPTGQKGIGDADFKTGDDASYR